MTSFKTYSLGILCAYFTLGTLLSSIGLSAEGTADLRTADGDPVMLFVGNPNFGNFAIYDGPEASRLNFRVAEAGEMVYIGLSRTYRSSGLPSNNGQYSYRVRSTATGEVVFGPILVDASNENLTTYAQAALGPGELTPGGYATDGDFSFPAPAAGEYFVEFDQVNGRPRYIGLWDITIANDGVRQNGRVYSRNWAFRVPELAPTLPECAFGAELSTKFYSYTSDGFVTEIDFTDSGFQPLSFTLAFNRQGPGRTGDLIRDRRSVPEQNVTDNVAEHLIFLQLPDPALFPDGACGDVTVSGTLTCQGNDTYCIPVTTTQEGQIEIILDFNANGVYDEDRDRILLYQFGQDRNFEACVPWDGLLADGTRPPDGTTVDLIVNYIQGIQHWALFDGELMRNGFCVTPVRPICGAAGPAPLFYDDINIPDAPGNGAPKQVLDGCECQTPGCRTWTNFEANASDNCSVDNDNTTGYGDGNTLNTWWFATSTSSTSFNVPLDAVTLSGPDKHCPGEPAELKVNYSSVNAISSIRWEGPSGPLPAANDAQQFEVFETGVYTVTVTDEFGCESRGQFTLMDVACMLNVSLVSVQCDDNGTATDPADDVYRAIVLVEGSNSDFFEANGQRYAYGSQVEIGPFAIADGDVVFTATDSEFSCCSEGMSIMAPAPCSNGCAITTGVVLETYCDPVGTTTDPTDDEFSFELVIDGMNLGSGWISETGQTGNYGQMATFGPFLIADGPVNLDFTDAEDDECVFTAVVMPPMSCSFDCELSVAVTNARCNDEGTPFDTTDDTYTFDLTVTGVNTPSPAYQVNGSGAYLYGQTVTVGPFGHSMADFTFDITDVGGQGCTTTYQLSDDELPVGCDVPCSLTVADARVVCDDFGNQDAGDDEYAVEVRVTTQDVSSRGWEMPDGRTAEYGEFVRVGRVYPNGEAFAMTIRDRDNPDCTAEVLVAAPTVDIACPQDRTTAGRPVTRLSFGGALTPQSPGRAGAEGLCWMADETFNGNVRYTERLTLNRDTTTANGLELYSFYLFAPTSAELRGAVLQLDDQEIVDCCALVNDAPVRAEPTNTASLPELPAGLYPAGTVLQQRFSVALRPRQVYTLITSSRNPDETADFRWFVVSASGEGLSVRKTDAVDPVVITDTITAVFPLLNPELTGFLDNANSLAVLGSPTVDSLCGQFELAFTDTQAGTCALATLTRSFDVEIGDSSLVGVCEQEMTFTGVDLVNITWPAFQVRFGCRDTFPLDRFGHPGPDLTGFPWIYLNGEAVALDSIVVDGLVTDYADTDFVREEDGGTTILRTWRVQDPCRQRTHMFEQVIKLENSGLPFFSCPISNHFCPIVEEDIMLWNTRPDDCLADIDIPEPVLNNVCDSLGWTFTTDLLRLELSGDTTLYQTLSEGEDRSVVGVPPGDYLIRYRGQHAQEAMPEQLCRIRVADLTDPVSLCRSNLNLSLPGSGEVAVRVQGVDLSSYDNCGIDSLLIRRSLLDLVGFGQWTERFTVFDCADVGFRHEVQLLAIDSAGNRNYCTSFITVRDNSEPFCTGLESVFISCDSLPNNFYAFDTLQLRSLFGMPEVVDNCSARAIELEPTVIGDVCSPDRIRRRFRAVDQHGNFSTGLYSQDIFVSPSLSYAIQLPMDTNTDCTDFTDTLRVLGAGCDSITYRFVDVFLPTEGDECRYVQRNYVITNWCEWDGVSEAIEIGRDENCSGTEGDAPVWLVRTADGIFVDADSSATNAFPAAGTVCAGGNPAGYLRAVTGRAGGRYVYAQRFRVFDQAAPELALTMLDSVCVDTASCRTDVTVGIEVFDACQVGEGDVLVAVDINNNGTTELSSRTSGELTGAFPAYSYTVNLPIGEHRMVFTVTDDCDNTVVVERTVSVFDCYVPVLTCREDRLYNLVALVEEGDVDMDEEIEEAAATVEATDIASCDFADCSGLLSFSVNRVGEPVDINQTSIVLDCEDRYEVSLEVYVWDEAFNPFSVQPDGTVGGRNWRSCTVLVRLQDPDLACNACAVDQNLTINGRVTSLGGTPLEEVAVSTAAGQTLTNRFGGYQLGGRVGRNYELSARLDDDPRRGLSTLDLVILRRQLLGIAPFATPFQRLAADLNRDGATDVLDALILQAIILGNREYYPAEAWRFVDASWDGTGAPRETIVLDGMVDCGFDHDFIGLRLGDLNDSYGEGAGVMSGLNSEGRSTARPTGMTARDAIYAAGETLTLNLNKADADRYIGGQFALSWDDGAVVFRGVAEGSALPAEGVRVRNNELRASWSRPGEEELTLLFEARREVRLSEAIRLADDDRLAGEAYDTELRIHPLYLNWEEAETDLPQRAETAYFAEASQLAVAPNPARSFTRIGLRIAAAQRVRVEAVDLQGRRMLSTATDVAAGEQWLRLDVQHWPAGVYQVSVFTAEGIVKGRVVRQ